MSASSIEWTEETWNPTVGCTEVSPGCDHCYAAGMAHRAMLPAHAGLTVSSPGRGPRWSGEVRCLPERLELPLRWRRPRRVFVDSMSDLFHPGVPDEFVAAVFGVMVRARQHTFQVLTKRPRRMERFTRWTEDAPPPNVWLGTSIEANRYVYRADWLRAASAAVRFVSLEPLLGPLPDLDLAGIDWVIVGGESGGGARPAHPAWVRDIRDRCLAEGTSFFFKQWGTWAPADGLGRLSPAEGERRALVALDGTFTVSADSVPMYRVGKRRGGARLDGVTWEQVPEPAAVCDDVAAGGVGRW